MFKVKDIIEQLLKYNEDSEVVIYNSNNDETYKITCVDADEGDESDEDSQVVIIVE